MSAPPSALLEAVNSALRTRDGTKTAGDGELSIRCLEPGHEDRHPSASWSTRRGCGRCHSCDVSWSTKKAAELLGVDTSANNRRPETVWKIRNRDGELIASHHRVDQADRSKRVWWSRPGGSKKLDRPASTLPLYLTEKLDTYDRELPVYIVEGEKAADAVVRLGLQAVGTVTGASSSPDSDVLRELDGFRVVVWPDHDAPGRSHARRVTAGLRSAGLDVESVVDTSKLWGGAPEDGQDAADLEALPDAGLPLLAPVDVDAQASNGAAILDQVSRMVRDYLAMPSYEALVAVVLWIAHTWIVQVLETTPRLAIIAAEAWSGKTRLLEVLELLVRAALRVGHTSAAPIFRVIDAGHESGELPTLLLDEAHQIFKPTTKADDGSGDLRSIVNDGHRYGGTVLRCDGPQNKVKKFRAFAPVAVAGLRNFLPDDTSSRSVVVKMRRRGPDEKVRAFRYRVAKSEADPIRDALETWADAVLPSVEMCRPEIPEGVEDRPADVWEPLLIVAELAGGDWPRRAREACLQFVKGAREVDEQSTGVQLLAHVREIFGDRVAVPTEELLEKLNADEERPWGGWRNGQGMDARGLAKQLRPFDVRPKDVRTGEGTKKGYRVDGQNGLADAWSRYLPGEGRQGRQGRQGNADGQSDVAHVADVADTWPATGTRVEVPEGWPRRASDGRPMVMLDDDDLVRGVV